MVTENESADTFEEQQSYVSKEKGQKLPITSRGTTLGEEGHKNKYISQGGLVCS